MANSLANTHRSLAARYAFLRDNLHKYTHAGPVARAMGLHIDDFHSTCFRLEKLGLLRARPGTSRLDGVYVPDENINQYFKKCRKT